MPELTLVLIGDKNSVEIGPRNYLLQHDKQTNKELFSSKLYDFCGRHIRVINMLGLKDVDEIPSNQGIHAFLLLLENGQHSHQYCLGWRWLKRFFGKRARDYLMTVVTHESDEEYEIALEELKANSRFVEQRYHTCTKSMMDRKEIADLLDKIDRMLSVNESHCFSEDMIGKTKRQRRDVKDKSNKKEERDSTTWHQHQTGTSDEVKRDDKQTTVEVSEEITREKKCQTETEALLGRLHLQVEREKRLTQADFLKIGPPMKQHHEKSEKDLAQAFLRRLMMLDYRARYIPVRPDSPEETRLDPDPVSDDGDLESFLMSSVGTLQTKQTHVHPMDVQMAVFHCSDNFLKQNMITKLSQCQYALPLLVPDPVSKDIECPLWTFRQITKSWKLTQARDGSPSVNMNIPICKAQTPLVLFFRLGSLSLSKSELMNTLINERHNTFFHRNCPGSNNSWHLMDGVAEITWYCPAGKPNDAFNDCIAFCNLHGDALLTEKQREILTEKSSINVVLVPTLNKDDKSWSLMLNLFKSQKPLICLIADDNCDAVNIKGKYKLGLKERSMSDISEQLKKMIGECLSSLGDSRSRNSFQLETMAEVSGIIVDERDPICQKGKSAAVKIVDLFKGKDVSNIKDKFLPCQGHLWHEWCKIKKELNHLKGHIEKDKCEKEEKLNEIRKKQCAVSCSKLIELFIESLSSLPPTEKEYFLKWMQILMDAVSADDLSSILQSYNDTWSEVLALKNKRDKSVQVQKTQMKLEDISKKLQSVTFGLEHIFREMGQIYEANFTTQTKHTQTDWSKYPGLAAQLMMSGYPLELMDGDAGHVPLTWISRLLQEVSNKLGNKRVFVLSVLGVQSSGKSTMLNAMFGLQFAVSAGRCTKGAFMQLVQVSEELKKDLKFDYVLVVDTEGLRAPELPENAILHHDNELATFVVGLGNMTLINIFGENSAEMQDVLQVVVQAFMRMKKVKLSPSCVFVHQNVTDVGAAEKNMDGKRRLQEKLDQMAELAAKEEGCNAESFSDIIEFDVLKDVKYSAQLWEGSPPMAPPNPGYCESIQELKSFILSKASKSDGITLLEFSGKVQDLWKALLKENFVFSFKNTLEITVYRKLEVQYSNWTWALRSNMLTIENQLYNTIENGKLDRVELSFLHGEMSKTYEEIKKEMTTYFADDKHKDILAQWSGRFKTKINEFNEELVKGVKKKLDKVIQLKNARKELDDKKTEFEKKLLRQSKEFARQMKDKATDEELEKQFNSVWSGWVTELTANTKPVEDINLKGDQIAILQELCIESALIDESRRSGKYKHIAVAPHHSDYVIPKKDKSERQLGFIKITKKNFKRTKSHSALNCEDEEQIKMLIHKVEEHSLKAIKDKPVATRGYTPTYLREVAKHVKEEVENFQSECKYTLTKMFTVDLLLYVFEKAESWILESQKKFKGNNDPVTYLESKKPQYYNIFRSFCKGNSSAVVLGELICEKLKASTLEAAYNKTAIGLAGQMKCNYPAFNGNRLNLEKYVLKSLAEEEDFNDFITYIWNPRKQTETFIKAEVEKHTSTEHRNEAERILKQNINDIIELVDQALSGATETVQIQKGDIDMWLREISSLLKGDVKFDTISSENFGDIKEFNFLRETIKKGLTSNTEQMSSFNVDKMKESREKPDEILIRQLCSCCWVKCPFCAAVCTNTIEDHLPDEHSVPFHRMSGIKGWHKRDTVELCITFCTTDVASNDSFYPHPDSEKSVPYNDYRTAGPEYARWKITPDESKLAYWKWFVCTFKNQLEDHYELKFEGSGEIPDQWRNISRSEAIKSLDEMCE